MSLAVTPIFALQGATLFSNHLILSTKSSFLIFQSINILEFPTQITKTRNLQRRANFLLQNIKNEGGRYIFALFYISSRFKNFPKTLFCDGNW